MTPERWQTAKEIFQAAHERAPEERTAFLAEACGSDMSLLNEVRSLLAHADQSFLERPPLGLFAAALSGSVEGQRIGQYRILREIDTGGMGEVYEAEQEAPLQRRVAIKLIRRGLDTAQVIARFESERQALALMSHPNIAQVFEAGATDEGRPYFVMEYVPGESITRYCDSHRLKIADRLRLFKQVCEGVQHAHQKGVVHRDLKPSNVLVTSLEESPFPKIIDFGVAKGIDRPQETEHGQKIGTPDYMSPEQAAGQLDIDTRTDVYSLGLILFELLLGKLPPRETPRLSHSLLSLGDGAAAVAANRQTEPATLARQLRGDLEWIVLKALEEDRERRYSSVSELAIDIERHLRNEPVLASPPSTRYRLGKFLRRHRVWAAASAIAVLALILGTVGTSAGYVRARRAEAQARQEAIRAGREAETARRTSNFLVGLFETNNPGAGAKGTTVTARELLDSGARKIAGELQGQPAVRATMLDTLGTTYQSLGLFDNAEALLREALSLRRKTFGETHSEVASSLYHLAELLRDRGKYPEAQVCYRQALSLREALLGPDSPDVAESLVGLGHVYYNQGQYSKAEPFFQRALAIWENARDAHVTTALGFLALLYRDQGKYDRAIPFFEQALGLQEKLLGPKHSDLCANLNNLADIYRALGQYAKAEQMLKRVLAINEPIMGPEHPLVSVTINNLAMVYRAEGRYTEAETLYRRGLAIDEKVLGPDHPEFATSLNNLGTVYREEGKYDLAEPLLIRALAIREKALGPEHPNVAGSFNNLGLLYTAQDRFTEAENLFKRALAIREKALGPEHPHVAVTLTNLANLYRKRAQDSRAEPLLRDALAIWDKLPHPSQPDLANTLESYAALLEHTGRKAEAMSLEKRGLEIRKKLADENNS